jgi:hypothetical protein
VAEEALWWEKVCATVAAMVVEESEQEDLALPVRVGRIGKIGTVHSISLPQLTKVCAFEAAVGLGALLGEELSGRSAPPGEMTAQRARGNARLWGRMSLIEREDVNDRARGAKGLLALESFCAVEGFRGKRPGLASV